MASFGNEQHQQIIREWEMNWEGLEVLLKDARISESESGKPTRSPETALVEECQHLVVQLAQYAKVTVDFFCKVYKDLERGGKSSWKLIAGEKRGLEVEKNDEHEFSGSNYSPGFVLKTLVEQISLDLNIIEQIKYQRFGTLDAQSGTGPDFKETTDEFLSPQSYSRLAWQ